MTKELPSIDQQASSLDRLGDELDRAIQTKKTFYWPWQTRPITIYSQVDKKLAEIASQIKSARSPSTSQESWVSLDLAIQKAKTILESSRTTLKTERKAFSIFNYILGKKQKPSEESTKINVDKLLNTVRPNISHLNDIKTFYSSYLQTKNLSIAPNNEDPISGFLESIQEDAFPTQKSSILELIDIFKKTFDSLKDPDLQQLAYTMLQKIPLDKLSSQSLKELQLHVDIMQKLKKLFPEKSYEEIKKLTSPSFTANLLNSNTQILAVKKIDFFINFLAKKTSDIDQRENTWRSFVNGVNPREVPNLSLEQDMNDNLFSYLQQNAPSSKKTKDSLIDSYLSMILESLGIPKDKFPAVLFDKRTNIILKYNLLSALEKAFSNPDLQEVTKTAILEYCQSLSKIPFDPDEAFEKIKQDPAAH